jgi:recombinase
VEVVGTAIIVFGSFGALGLFLIRMAKPGVSRDKLIASFRSNLGRSILLGARRGELLLTVAIGYVKERHNRIVIDPNRRVREGIALVFLKFAEFQSIRQVHLWLRQERITLPAVRYTAAEGRSVVWKLPVYNTVHHILTNPIYAGAYAFGRTCSRVTIADGRKRIVRGHKRDRDEWEVLLMEHHEGYLSWAEFERNQRLIADNANSKGLMVRGSVRWGETLLAGLLRCGHCGRKLHVAYGGKSG